MLEYTAAKLIMIEHARAKYAWRKDSESNVRTAFAQPSLLPRSNAGAGRLAHILISTFANYLPITRKETIFGRPGVETPKQTPNQTLCEWKLASGELLAVLRAPLIAYASAAPRLHSDDTTMPLIVGG
jgi:transposase